MPKEFFDTVVIGAGPAGAMSAREAARAGSVLLAESFALPREKSCGGMLNPYARRFLSRIAELPGDLVLSPEQVTFRYVDWDRGIVKPTRLTFLNIDRTCFDQWLLSLLSPNVELWEGWALDSFAEDGFTVRADLRSRDGRETTVRCKTLICADGARSRARRALGAGSVATYVTLQDFVELRADIPSHFDCIYMRDIGDSYAYSYLVPKGETAIVGSVCYPKTKRPWEGHEQAVETLRAAFPALGSTFRREASAAVCVRSPDDVVAGRGRILLAGEAGGFMSPTSGEGISFALATGASAGRAVLEGGHAHALARHIESTSPMRRDIVRRLRWLPVMESPTGRYLAGFVPNAVISKVTERL